MKTESNIKPQAISLEVCASGAQVVFCENIQAVEREGEQSYTYDEYRISVPYRENLLDAVKLRPAEWLNAAKHAEYTKLASEVRAKRDELLRESDARMSIDRMHLPAPSEENSSAAYLAFLQGLANAAGGAWAQYRQALRDIPTQSGFPYAVVFPEKPTEGKGA